MNHVYPNPPTNSMEPWNQSHLRKKGVPWWGWVLIVMLSVGLLSCVSCFSLLIFLDANAPATSVYTGNQVPAEYLGVMNDLGVLDSGERINYFYSDAFMDIREGFYFVSDRKVMVYSDQRGQLPSNVVEFADITDVELDRDESFFVDSTITMKLTDGSIVAFPVSSEVNGDKRFYEAICHAIEEQAALHTAHVE